MGEENTLGREEPSWIKTPNEMNEKKHRKVKKTYMTSSYKTIIE